MPGAGNENRFDIATLDAWMHAHIEGYAGPLQVEKFAGGQSNPTFRLSTPARAYVLRRKPTGQLLAGAHAVDREYRIISALGAQAFPVPEAYAYCDDDKVIGTAFYIMALIEGRIIWDPTFSGLPRPERAVCFDAMNATIAKLHGIDYRAAGLEGYGKPGDYFTRQIARWTRSYREDDQAGRIPAMDRLADWLPAHIPDDGDNTSIVHGDFRCDNIVFHPTEPRVVAVLDWELSTLGHPLADFTYHLMMYRMPKDLPGGMMGVNPMALGLPTEAEYVAAYCRRTGRGGISALDFYLAFNMFRFAGIIHGIKGRLLRGNASSAHAAKMVSQLNNLADHAWNQAVAAGAK